MTSLCINALKHSQPTAALVTQILSYHLISLPVYYVASTGSMGGHGCRELCQE